MALNSYFLQGSSNEQFLIQDLVNEQLKIYGIDVYYLPRKMFSKDNILGEVTASKFDDSFILEAYLDNYEGYAPGSDIMSKFGLRLKNEINLIISSERFEEFIVPFMGASKIISEGNFGADYDFSITGRPREGDLIWFPLGERLFEIKRVESEKPFYQLGKTYVFELNCELYEYENDEIDTSVEAIDTSVEDEGYITTINLSPQTGQVATASITLTPGTGGINTIVINDGGTGYTSAPTIEVEPPSLGVTAQLEAVVTDGSISKVYVIDSGTNYNPVDPPTITITGGGGNGASLEANINQSGSSLRSITLTDGGSGYVASSPPTITISPTGSNFNFDVGVNESGSVSSIKIINGGRNMLNDGSNIATLSSPTVGVGAFIYNETVTGSVTGNTATVRSYDIDDTVGAESRKLLVTNITGQFAANEVITGSESEAAFKCVSFDDNSVNDPFDFNEQIETEADGILDFTESNPFGTY